MDSEVVQEMSYLVGETVESLEGSAASIDALIREGTLERDVRVRLFAVRDAVCVCAGRLDSLSDLIDLL